MSLTWFDEKLLKTAYGIFSEKYGINVHFFSFLFICILGENLVDTFSPKDHDGLSETALTKVVAYLLYKNISLVQDFLKGLVMMTFFVVSLIITTNYFSPKMLKLKQEKYECDKAYIVYKVIELAVYILPSIAVLFVKKSKTDIPCLEESFSRDQYPIYKYSLNAMSIFEVSCYFFANFANLLLVELLNFVTTCSLSLFFKISVNQCKALIWQRFNYLFVSLIIMPILMHRILKELKTLQGKAMVTKLKKMGYYTLIFWTHRSSILIINYMCFPSSRRENLLASMSQLLWESIKSARFLISICWCLNWIMTEEHTYTLIRSFLPVGDKQIIEQISTLIKYITPFVQKMTSFMLYHLRLPLTILKGA